MKINRDITLIVALLLVVCGINPVIVWLVALAYGRDIGLWHVLAVGLAMLVVAINVLLGAYAFWSPVKKEEE